MANDLGFHPHLGTGAAQLVVEFHNSQPIDLLEFSASLQALAREHQGHMQRLRPAIDVEETKLLIIDVRKGSIVFELAAALVPIVTSVEVTNSVLTFVDHIKCLGSSLAQRGGRATDATTQQLKNMGDTVQALASDQQGNFVIAARHQSGEVIQEFRVENSGIREIIANAQSQRREIEDRSSSALSKVLMRLHQSSLADARVGKRTSEKGVIERIDTTPRSLVYVSELAGQRIKEEIIRPGGNPYGKGFIVDVDVETLGGRPKVYRILDVHDVIELDDDD